MSTTCHGLKQILKNRLICDEKMFRQQNRNNVKKKIEVNLKKIDGKCEIKIGPTFSKRDADSGVSATRFSPVKLKKKNKKIKCKN